MDTNESPRYAINVRVTHTEHEQIHKLAAADNRSVSNYVRLLIRCAINEQHGTWKETPQ